MDSDKGVLMNTWLVVILLLVVAGIGYAVYHYWLRHAHNPGAKLVAVIVIVFVLVFWSWAASRKEYGG